MGLCGASARDRPAAAAADLRRRGRDARLRAPQRLPLGEHPLDGRVFAIIGSSNLSLGPVASSVSAMKYVVPWLVEGVKRRLLLDQEEADWTTFLTADHAELRPTTPPESEAA